MDNGCHYGTEIWGSGKCVEIERIQMEAGRRILGVGRKMANAVVRGELGWWTMRAQREMKKLRYWASGGFSSGQTSVLATQDTTQETSQ